MTAADPLIVIGGGLAGCEAAWQAAIRGVPVRLVEMRPEVETPVHRGEALGQLVCSNSLGGRSPEKAPGILKRELAAAGSLLIRIAHECSVPAGDALAVDRELFSSRIEQALLTHPLISLSRGEAKELPGETAIIATGPLTSAPMAASLEALFGKGFLFFFDATSPIVSADFLDLTRIYAASRYDRGERDYLNCPLTREEYERFHDALVHAEKAQVKDFEAGHFFEGCVPVEELASRGVDTLRFGPLKPVGLPDPLTGEVPHAVVQLRRENGDGTMYNLVGFQTRLRWSEQERVFRLIPGLEAAEFLRFGVMHRNIYVSSPGRLSHTLALRERPHLFLAGQLTGVEGYVESIATGLLAGINGARRLSGSDLFEFPGDSAIGSLVRYICTADPESFQPMNVNMGLFPPPPQKVRSKKERNHLVAARALEAVESSLPLIRSDIVQEVCSP